MSGRGVAREDALRTCLAEAAERWCAVFDETRPGRWALEREIAARAVSPDSLLLVSDCQYETAGQWNRAVEPDHRLPRRRDAGQPLFWVEARSLVDNAPVMVPAAQCFLGYPLALDHGFALPDSSGLAAGDDAASAVQRALFELIERDAVAIWWYGRGPRPALGLDRSKLPVLAGVEAWLARQGRRLWLLDIGTDLDVSVAAAVSCGEDGCDLSLGFAAGWTREDAGRGALGELVQFEATKRLSRGRTSPNANNLLDWCGQACVGDHSFLRPAAAAAIESPADTTPDMKGLIDRLRQRGMEPVVLELSRKDVPLSVVRVVAPGLRPIWPRFAPGRLYDVPVALGWRQSPLREAELNPVPILY